MTPREFKAAVAISEFVSDRERNGRPGTPLQQQRRDDKLIELLFEFAEATKEAHQQNTPMISPATDII